MQPDNMKQKVAAGSVVTLLAVVLLTAVGTYEANHKATGGMSMAASVTAAPVTTSTNSQYKDGTYSASTTYYVPHGSESIKVTLTVKSGVVINSGITNSESDPESARFQEDFANEYQSYVVGKNIADIKLSYVAGASDTTDGFNQAVHNIANQAKA